MRKAAIPKILASSSASASGTEAQGASERADTIYLFRSFLDLQQTEMEELTIYVLVPVFEILLSREDCAPIPEPGT